MINLKALHRFWSHVDRRGPDDCWPWLGAKTKQGYGSFSACSRNKRAHRIAWSLGNGQSIPDSLMACHTCDNPSCVNPAHLWLGTNADNMADCRDKNRIGGPVADNISKTHCKFGHALAGDNVHWKKQANNRFWRGCRICERQYQRDAYAREAAARKVKLVEQDRHVAAVGKSTITAAVRERLCRIAASGAQPGRNRNMMLTPDDAQIILSALEPSTHEGNSQ